MTYRKTWFGYVLWALYTVVCVAVLVLLVGGVWTSYLAGIPYAKGFPRPVVTPLAGLSDNTQFLIGLLILPLTVLLYCVLRGISGAVRRKRQWKEESLRIWEGVTVFLILAGGLALRVLYGRYVLFMAAAEHKLFLTEQMSGMEYYEMAVTGAASEGLNRISMLYVRLLMVAVAFLGHKLAAAVVLQAVLQLVAMLLAYVVTRKSAGRLPACVVLLYLSCSFCCLRSLGHFGADWLLLILFLLGMLAVVCFLRKFCANRRHKTAAVVGVIVLAYVLMLLGAVWLESTGGFDTGKLRLWYRCSEVFANRQPYLYDGYLLGLLAVPAAFLVFEFFRSGREQNYTPWMLFCLIVAPTPMAVIGDGHYGLLSLYIWAVLAGLGLQNCIFGGQAKVVQALIEQINATAEQAEESDVAALEAEYVKTAGQEEERKPQEPTPRYIENPLPLPKKHVRKEMDYQYPVEEKDMKYDIDVSDQDDFDV